MKLFRGISQQVVLAKSGAIIPLSNNHCGDNNSDNPQNLEFIVFPGASNEFELIEDNGSKNLTQDDIAKTLIKLEWNSRPTLTINSTKGNTSCIPKSRDITISLRGVQEDTTSLISVKNSNSIKYDAQTKTLSISINNWDTAQDIVINLDNPNCINDNSDYKQKIHKILFNAYIDYTTKDQIHWLLKKGYDKLRLINDIKSLNIDGDLFDAILETL